MSQNDPKTTSLMMSFT